MALAASGNTFRMVGGFDLHGGYKVHEHVGDLPSWAGLVNSDLNEVGV